MIPSIYDTLRGMIRMRQRSVLQPVSGNGGRKMKAKAETRHGAKERSTNLTALRLIARQGAEEKSQLEEWKTDLLLNLTNEIAQIHKAQDDAMEAQHEEIERQREQFKFEIEVLRERILDVERKKEKTTQEQTRKDDGLEPAHGAPEKETAQAQGEKFITQSYTTHKSKRTTEIRNGSSYSTH